MTTRTSKQPKIIAWMKPSCGWSNGVRAVFAKYGLAYEDRDIINEPANYREMVELTGQPLQPCVQVGETILADISGEELEEWLLENGIVEPVEGGDDVPLSEGCADHAAPSISVAGLLFRRQTGTK